MRRHVPLLAVLAFTAAGAQAGGQSVGFPETGKLDPQRVLESRYGKPHDARPAAAAATAGVDGGATVNLIPRGFDGGLTGVAIDSTSAAAQERVPISFGQVFAAGDLTAAERLVGRLADG